MGLCKSEASVREGSVGVAVVYEKRKVQRGGVGTSFAHSVCRSTGRQAKLIRAGYRQGRLDSVVGNAREQYRGGGAGGGCLCGSHLCFGRRVNQELAPQIFKNHSILDTQSRALQL